MAQPAKAALAHSLGAARKKAIVAVARQLAVDFPWRIKPARLTAQLGLTI